MRTLATAAHVTILGADIRCRTAHRQRRARTGGRSGARPNATDGLVGISAVRGALTVGALGVAVLVRRRVAVTLERPHPVAGVFRPRHRAALSPGAGRGWSPSGSWLWRGGPRRGRWSATDPGTRSQPIRISTPAPAPGPRPDFTLSDQFGRPVSLRLLPRQGRDPRVQRLGVHDGVPAHHERDARGQGDARRAGTRSQLLGVGANPQATALAESARTRRCTGCSTSGASSPARCRSSGGSGRRTASGWTIEPGQIDHTPAVYVIDPHGTLRGLYMTQKRTRACTSSAQLLAHEASRLLPGHPPVRSDLSYAQVRGSPRAPGTLPRAGGGTVRLGPGRTRACCCSSPAGTARDIALAGSLEALDRYQRRPRRRAAPADRGRRGERGAVAARARLPARPAAPLAYPVAVDRSGRVADGYQRPGPALARARVPQGSDALVRTSRPTVAQSPRAHPARARGARAPPRSRPDAPAGSPCAGGLAAAAGGAAPAGRPAARSRRRSPPGCARCAAIRSWSTRGRPGAPRASKEFPLFAAASRATAAGSRSSAPTPTIRPATRGHSWPSTTSAIRATGAHGRSVAAGGVRGCRRRSSSTGPARSPTSTPGSTTPRAPRRRHRQPRERRLIMTVRPGHKAATSPAPPKLAAAAGKPIRNAANDATTSPSPGSGVHDPPLKQALRWRRAHPDDEPRRLAWRRGKRVCPGTLSSGGGSRRRWVAEAAAVKVAGPLRRMA